MTETTLAFSVDCEPNKDDTFDGVRDAMRWFDGVVPRGTVFATYRVAERRPDMLAELANDHELGVHVHPREFGYEHDQFADLSGSEQRTLISRTRDAIVEATGVDPSEVTAFRAGRHSASRTTFEVLADLGFRVDASVHVRYDERLPRSYTVRGSPFTLPAGLLEVPTTYVRPPLLSRASLRVFPERELTATASTLRSDSPVYSGLQALRTVFDRGPTVVSMYMHPYDATTHHPELENAGEPFRRRLGQLLDTVDAFASVSEVAESAHSEHRDGTSL